MDSKKSIDDYFPFIKKVSEKLKIKSEYLLAGLSILILFFLKRTIFGGLLSTLLTLIIPLRDAILAIKSPSVKQEELKKLLTVFIIISVFMILENIGVNKIIPLFSFLKIGTVFWTGYEQNNLVVKEILINNIPNEWLTYGDSISNAVKAASKTLGEKVKVKNGSIEIDSSIIKKTADKKE